MIILCCGCSCGLFLEKNWVVVGVVVSYCTKIGLMLLLGCVIKSNCGCGRSSQVDCVVVVVVVDQFSFCSSLIQMQDIAYTALGFLTTILNKSTTVALHFGRNFSERLLVDLTPPSRTKVLATVLVKAKI